MKRTLRSQHREARRALEPEAIEAASASITRTVLELPEILQARTVALYHALPREVQTAALGLALGRADKRCVYPRMIDGSRVLAFAPLGDPKEMIVASMGIREPLAGNDVDLQTIDLFVVPGLAFDAQGGRLGQGGGYYDSTMAASPRALRIGVCFDVHFTEEPLPVLDHDQRVDLVVTPSRVVRIPGRIDR